MFSLFKKSVSPKEFADATWEAVRNWPEKYGSALKDDFGDSFEKLFEDVLDEMVYFMGFSTDFALHCHLSANPKVESIVRDVFATHLGQFALDHKCKPLPPGNWVGEGLIWLPNGESPKEIGNPLDNLSKRFALYAESIKRRKDKSTSECLAHLLAGWCGNLDIAFIYFAANNSLSNFEAIQKMLKSIKLKA